MQGERAKFNTVLNHEQDLQRLSLEPSSPTEPDNGISSPFAQSETQFNTAHREGYALRSRSASDSACLLNQQSSSRDNSEKFMGQAKSLGRPSEQHSRRSRKSSLSPARVKSLTSKATASPKAKAAKRLSCKSQKARQRNFAVDFTNDPAHAMPCLV